VATYQCVCTCTQIIIWLGRVIFDNVIRLHIIVIIIATRYKLLGYITTLATFWSGRGSVEKSMLLKFGYPSRLFALWSGELFQFFIFKLLTLFDTVKFCHRMPTTVMPLPSFRDLPATVANLTATPGLPAHVVATPAPPPLHLPPWWPLQLLHLQWST
jgi:hypothetical protein